MQLRGKWILATIGLTLGGVACSPPPAPPTTGTLVVSTQQTVCGGVVPPPGEPFCRSSLISRTVQVTRRGVTIAEGTSGVDGQVRFRLDPGSYVVIAADAPSFEICDHPTVAITVGATTTVTQDCTIMAP